jgi:SAM-dependent methyltransferase
MDLKNWILNNPNWYNFFQKIISRHGGTVKYFTENYILPLNPKSVLEIGCGTGTCLQYLPSYIEYTGVDISADYIDYAKIKYGKRGNFILGNLTKLNPNFFKGIDLVIAPGFFHHIKDRTINDYICYLKQNLQNEFKLFSIDPCFIDKRFSISNYIVSKDRGKFIRTESEYLRILKNHFMNTQSIICKDLLKFPYHSCIIFSSDLKY